MSVTEGMDTDRVRGIVEQLLASSQGIQDVAQVGDGAMSVLRDAWQGQDLQHFDQQWHTAGRQLHTASEYLRTYGERLRHQAEDQDTTSQGGGGGRGGPSGGGDHGDGVRGGNPDLADDTDATYEKIDGPVVEDGVQPTDVKQGALGDCWLISTMRGVAAANPKLIQDHIKDNGDGTYTVTLYEDGKPVQVTVTGDFPAKNGDPVYADNETDRELWPLIYEKAMAQHMGGSYEDLDGDWPARAIEAMTGNEVTTYDEGLMPWDGKDLPPASDLKAKLEDGGVIIASTDGDGKKASDGSLVSNHAYTVTAIDDQGNVTVQNPWGSHEKPITMTYEEFEKRFARFDVGSAKK